MLQADSSKEPKDLQKKSLILQNWLAVTFICISG